MTNVAALRRAVMAVALINLGYGIVEFTVSQLIGSVSLVADSVDFLEDAALNLLIFFAFTWSLRRRANVGHVLAVIIFIPSVFTLVTAVIKIMDPTRPDTVPMSLAALGALIANLTAAAILARHRHHGGSLARAAWLSARNDALANVAVIAAALVALAWVSGWPDIIVGIGIAYLNADAGIKVWRAATKERLEAKYAEA
ncbi:cation transporter [Demequina sp. SYSU T00039]|uniref:Cation transporter n=1 Tax=Demequina lignilytica TaxID=3051663 RepID=A0AAW7M921_9MICO|nr:MULTISPECIES: cation transporter [unclassified Demequina]MDN4477378.1 cation transporter [Demequina sp. SYSU T00039-1]MDN4487551.1 cation transporter [Demequina sp. SYSU T00039]